jgi:ribose transport system substrate-binding protein
MRRAAALAICGFVAWAATAPAAPARHYTIGFANLTDDPQTPIEATGFTGAQVRESFALAARTLPVDLVFYDNHRDGRRAVTNAEAASRDRVDLLIEYCDDVEANRSVAAILKKAGIPVLAINYPVGDAPLYAADDQEAGRVAGEALGEFAVRNWEGHPLLGVLVGDWARGGPRPAARAAGVRAGLSRRLKTLKLVQVEPAALGRVVSANPGAKLLVATMSDPLALGAKQALEATGRAFDAVIVSQGLDPSIHGGQSDRREIDPNNRSSIVLGSVAYYLDRYGYEVLPLALAMLRGEQIPARTVTHHVLVTAGNVWQEYPPMDLQ